MKGKSAGFSIVVPVHNVEENIECLVAEIHRAMPQPSRFEIIYVDDGSDDATPSRLAAARSRFPLLRSVRHSRRCGQSAALLTGVKCAQYPWIATLDGDCQNDPRDLPAVLAIAAECHDVASPQLVAGLRRLRQDSWVRRLSSRVANAVRRRFLHDEIFDTGCGLKAFRRDDFLALPYFDHMHRFLPALFLRNGGKVHVLPVSHRPRLRGQSKYGVGNRLLVGIIDLFGVWWLQHRVTLPVIVRDGDES